MLINRKPLTCMRFSEGTRDSLGKFIPSSASEFTIHATVQPMRYREVQLLPEGRREAQGYVLYSNDELQTLDVTSKPDIVVINGKNYDVILRYNWDNSIITHFKYGVVRNSVK
jgi:hypothetical protein